jgi:GT2 family glycosyltransferase
VIIVDDGDLGDFPQQKILKDAGIESVYCKKLTPGVCASRNIGAELARGDVVFYLDDDVELTEYYVETIMEVFESDPENTIGGVGGLIINDLPVRTVDRCLRYLLELMFLNSGFREGRFMRSGFSVNYGSTCFPLRQMTRVQFLSGGVCAYRREVFDEFSWSKIMKGRALGEDKDLGIRLSEKYRLFLHPEAKLFHYESPVMRVSSEVEGYEVVIRTYEFFCEHVRKGRFDILYFWYAIVGYLVVTLFKALVTRSSERLRMVSGVLRGIREVRSGKVV